MVVIRSCWIFALHVRAAAKNSPMAHSILGPNKDPKNGIQNWITFSFLLSALLGSSFNEKHTVECNGLFAMEKGLKEFQLCDSR